MALQSSCGGVPRFWGLRGILRVPATATAPARNVARVDAVSVISPALLVVSVLFASATAGETFDALADALADFHRVLVVPHPLPCRRSVGSGRAPGPVH